jgi:hypothetical protein
MNSTQHPASGRPFVGRGAKSRLEFEKIMMAKFAYFSQQMGTKGATTSGDYSHMFVNL